MKKTEILCDRCKQPMTYNGWVAIIKYPKLKRAVRWRITEIFNGNPSGYDYCDIDRELCADCTKKLKKWLKGEEQTGENK